MGMIFTILGIAVATVLAGIGSVKGVGAAAQASMGVLSEDSSMFGKMLVLTLLPGTQGLYGFIVGFLMLIYAGVLGGGDVVTWQQGLAYLAALLCGGPHGYSRPHFRYRSGQGCCCRYRSLCKR